MILCSSFHVLHLSDPVPQARDGAPCISRTFPKELLITAHSCHYSTCLIRLTWTTGVELRLTDFHGFDEVVFEPIHVLDNADVEKMAGQVAHALAD
jgi:hypothetical protein